MKKKKQRVAATTEDLESIIHSHGEFFDHLIELIPAKFYLQNDDDSKPWYGGLSKAAKASMKLQTKQNIKLARRQKFDPDHQIAKGVVTDEENLAVKGIDDEEEGNKEDKEKSVTYEELRQRLRQKIELLRGNRGESGRRNDFRKRKRDGESDGGECGKETRSVDEDEDGEGEEIIEFGKVRLENEDGKSGIKKKKKRKLSKVKELERATRLQEVKKEKPGIAERETWNAAASRAMGVKVHDNARLIKESIKKEKKKKEKNAEKWKDRVDTQVKMKEERQRKRNDNIQGRIKDNKMRKIAKREKKLMRPGFEGRKQGFITKE